MADKSKAEELKNQGNTAMQQGKADEAIKLYSQAIAIDSSNHAYFSNRSAAYAKIGNWDEALKDAEKSIEINAKWGKGYQRKGIALHNMHRFEDAIEAFQKGLELEPSNAQIKQGLDEAERAFENELRKQMKNNPQAQNMFKQFEELFQGDVIGRVKAMPEIAHLAGDKEFVKKVEAIARDPSKLSEYLQDDRVKQYMSIALQYQAVEKMSPEERGKLAQAQEEARRKREKAEEDERDRKRKLEKEMKEAEERKKKEEELSKLTSEQKQALEIKEKANKLYSEKKFEEALGLYQQASNLDPTNIVYLNNICAVQLELKNFSSVIETAQKAVEIGRSQKAPFEHIGRALQRLGSAYHKMGDFENAVGFLQKSLTEHRDGNTLNLLKKVEKEWEDKKKKEYINPELSQQAKEEGNNFFRENKFAPAVERYTEAIKRNPQDHTIYTNRAQSYIKLMALPEALKDCEECIKMKPDFVKAYLRKGQVHFMMKEFQKALQTYEKGLELDPNNQEISEGVRKTVEAINSHEMDPETVKRNVEKDPELQRILTDPIMQQVLKDLGTNPKAINEYMKDASIRANIEKLIAAGVISTR